MIFHIHHRTTYTYDRPVFLEPHLIRLKPRSDAFQRLIEWNIRFEPAPSGQSVLIDAEGADAARVWFESSHTVFELVADSVVETLCTDPFDFLLETESLQVPLQLRKGDKRVLGPSLENAMLSEDDRSAAGALARAMADKAGGQSVPFLAALCTELYRSIETVVRMESGLQGVAETLGAARGACRDTTLVFMACCRAMGIPARFVSGYQQGDPDSEQRELHAWAEAYLPGAGWRGYDPTHGLAVSDAHVALAASADPEAASPLTGTFRGTGATSRLEHRIHITTRSGY